MRKWRQKIRKHKVAEICPEGNTSRTRFFTEIRLLLVITYGGRGANVDGIIRSESSVSEGPGAICWSAGLQQTLPKFHRLLLIRLLIKEQSYWLSHSDTDMNMDTDTEKERSRSAIVRGLNEKTSMYILRGKYPILLISEVERNKQTPLQQTIKCVVFELL